MTAVVYNALQPTDGSTSTAISFTGTRRYHVMMLKIAINGFGRIGRNVLRALYENG